MNDMLTMDFTISWLSAGVRLAAPVLIAALGEILLERAGVLNVGIEGAMLIGALVSFAGSFYTGSATMGLLAAVAAGALMGLFLGWMYITVQADQMVVGMSFNVFAVSLTSLGYRVLFGIPLVPPMANKFGPLHIPLLSDIPIVGQVLFQHNILVYLAFLGSVGAGVLLYRTKFGLMVRAVGEDPRAGDAAGIRVYGIRYLCAVLAGAAAGLGGAALVLGQLGLFRDNVTAGRGFIALAIVIFGRWNPYWGLVVALAFGMAEALALSLQMTGLPIPPQFLLMLPYVMAALATSGLFGRPHSPAALTQPYNKE